MPHNLFSQGSLGYTQYVSCACLWGRVTATDTCCGTPTAGGHLRAPHNGLGSLNQSPYGLVGSEWALAVACTSALDSVILSSNSDRLSDKDSPPDNIYDNCDGCLGCTSSICCVCGLCEIGGCAHAIARLGPIQSLVALGTDVCGANNVETRIDFDDGSLKQLVVSAPPPPHPHILAFRLVPPSSVRFLRIFLAFRVLFVLASTTQCLIQQSRFVSLCPMTHPFGFVGSSPPNRLSRMRHWTR